MKTRSKIELQILLTAIAIGGVVILSSILAAISAINNKHDFFRKMSSVEVIPPSSFPSVSQESIDLAIVMFNIRIPSSVKHPTYDPDLVDRGVTILNNIGQDFVVKVGRSAFSSWGFLASTLAHEIEVHCNQNFTLIRMKDMLFGNGTLDAEREAYQHELHNTARFGLSIIEKLNIKETMEFYYPINDKGSTFIAKLPTNVKKWLAR